MIGKSTKFSHVGQNKCKLFANHTFSPVFKGTAFIRIPCLITLQNYEDMKAVYDPIDSVIAIVNVIVDNNTFFSSSV